MTSSLQSFLSLCLHHKSVSPYLRLMRLDRPIGTWLCLMPAWWGLVLGAPTLPIKHILLFALGAVVVRGAGCTINDIWDRHIDGHVARTKTRPLPQNDLSLNQAILWFAIQGVVALSILSILPLMSIYVGLGLVPFIVLYPLMKRYTYWPQLFLGIVFNGGILIGWFVYRSHITPPIMMAYAACICWTVGYDTIYAFQDQKDDKKIGLKSTALRLGFKGGKAFVLALYALFFFLLTNSFISLNFYLTCPLLLYTLWSIYHLDLKDSKACHRFFLWNKNLGWVISAFLFLERGIN